MWAEVSFILSQFTRMTDELADGRTDRRIAHHKTAAALLQRGKKRTVVKRFILFHQQFITSYRYLRCVCVCW